MRYFAGLKFDAGSYIASRSRRAVPSADLWFRLLPEFLMHHRHLADSYTPFYLSPPTDNVGQFAHDAIRRTALFYRIQGCYANR